MPAGREAYLNNGNALIMDEEDTIGTIITSFDALVAAYVYGALDIKALFYLDAIVEVQITDDAGAVIGTGFIGLVIVNGNNYRYHAVARRFKGSLPVFNDADTLINDYVALNDGGLNTLGDAILPVLNSRQTGNIIVAPQIFKSSYYALTTSFGFQFFDAIAGWISVSKGTISQNSNLSQGHGYGNDWLIEAGQQGRLRAFITNEEGTFFSNENQFTVLARPIITVYSQLHASYSCTGNGTTAKTLYVGKPIVGIGTKVYGTENLDSNIGVSEGFYNFGGAWYEVRYTVAGDFYSVVNNNICGNYPSNDPAYTTAVTSFGRSFDPTITTSANGCLFLTQGEPFPQITIYRNNSNGKYYNTANNAQNANSAAFVANGFYFEDTGAMTYNWVQILSGDIISQGNC